MILDLPVDVQGKTVGLSERGFGTILIFDPGQGLNFKYLGPGDIKGLDTKSKAYELAGRLFMQKPQPQEVAIVDKAGDAVEGFKKVLEENRDFFFLTYTDNATETIKDLSKPRQVNDKLCGVTVSKYEDAEKLFEEIDDNTFVVYHDDPEVYATKALAMIMSYEIGGKTTKSKTVQGVKKAEVTKTQLKALHDHNIFSYIEKLGVLQTTEGEVLSGEYIDVVLGEYWIRFRPEEALQRLVLAGDKIPYTDRGIGMPIGGTEKVLSRAVDQRIVESGQYKIDYKLKAGVPSNEVALRKYNYVVWTVILQGAIHTGQISGILTYDVVNEGEGK